MNMSTILIWNAQGLNMATRCDSIHDVVLSSKADIVCPQETKVATMSCQILLATLSSNMISLLLCLRMAQGVVF